MIRLNRAYDPPILTLNYGAIDTDLNSAVALKEFLERRFHVR